MDSQASDMPRHAESESMGANTIATSKMEQGNQKQFDGVQDSERPRQQTRERARGNSRGRGGRCDRGGRHSKKDIGRAQWRYAKDTLPSNHLH